MRSREGGVVPEEQCIFVIRYLLGFMNHFVVSRASMSSSSSIMHGSSGVGQSAVSFQFGKCVPEDAIAAWGL